jgi:exopolyphosphatase / guanosine-5'-triphosphate,3'-diphosphate pyrophosphatase
VATKTQAVIEIGSTGIRALIADVHSDGSFSALDSAGKPVPLGRDVFTSGSLSRDSVRECIAVLRGFKELMQSYGLKPEDVRVIGTSAIREADNRDALVDRIAMQTGFKVDIVEDIEENHYMYLAVQHALGEDAKFFSRSNSIIIEIGGGSTELMLLRRGKIVAVHSLHLGTVRADEQMRSSVGSAGYLMRYLADNVRTICDSLDDDLPLTGIRSFIVIGSDARFAAQLAGVDGRADYRVIPRADFEALVDRLKGLSPEAIVSEFRLPYAEAEALLPGLVITGLFLERTGAEELVVPSVSIREGLLIAIAGGKRDEIAAEIAKQALASALSLGRRYHFDEEHALHVASLSLFLFDRLISLHGMGSRERMLLEAAALLHDIGTFIRSSGHHHHSEYIVKNSEIFGLQRDDIAILAELVRYHRKSVPARSHQGYMSLPRMDRAIVIKLASFLRVADALDRGHTQRVSFSELELREDSLLIKTAGQMDLSLERLSLAEKADLFEDVFGLKVLLA